MTEESYRERHISLKKRRQVFFRSHPSGLLTFAFGLSGEVICAGIPRAIKELKNTIVSELGYLLSQISEKAIADAEERLSAGVPA